MASYSLAQLEMSLDELKLVNDCPPCICISGLRNLSLTQMVKNCDFIKVIQTLFQLLNIPAEWVLEIRNPPHLKSIHDKIPFEAYIYLIDNHIKLQVYKTLLNHLKHTNQRKVHIKLVD